MPRIAHISDLHLQSGVPERQAQVEPILAAVNDTKPDLVVISGDVTDDGWDSTDELRWAKGWLDERMDCRWMVLPGNHDVGNFVSLPEGRIDAGRVRRWRQVFPDTQPIVLQDWLIIGLNSMMFGADLEARPEEIDALHINLASARRHNQPVALVLHSPLFVNRPDEPADSTVGYWLGPPAPRQALWTSLQQSPVKLIASGHVHQTRLAEVDGVTIAWAPPASGTWVHAPGLPNPSMPARTGFFLHELRDDGTVSSDLVECAPMLKLYEHNPGRDAAAP